MEEISGNCKTCKHYWDGQCKLTNKTALGKCSVYEDCLVNLIQLHDKYKELLYIEDTKRIDILLAVVLSAKLEGIPIWLILVGASGDMKSAQLNAIRTPESYLLHNLTSKTLVNGYKDKLKFPDLAPELHNKIVLIPDMAQLLKLPPIEKGELWGQLRDLYDGFAGKSSGMGSTAKYKDLKVTLIGGSTPAIDSQILVHQDLGTRELIYRTEGNLDKNKVMEKCFENEEIEERIKKELEEITTRFLVQRDIKRAFIASETYSKIKEIATYITYMRATAEVDYSDELRNIVYPEEPTRIAKQLKKLYVCLMSLSDDYPEDRTMEILWKIGRSSAFPLRIKVFEFLLNEKEYSTSQVAEILHIGKSTAKRELNILWNMNLVCCRKEPTNYPNLNYDYWRLNIEHSFIKSVSKSNR